MLSSHFGGLIKQIMTNPSGEMDTSESRDSGGMEKWAMSLNPCQMASSVIICIILTVNGCRKFVVKINKKSKD